jgi:uncharacterized protein
MIELPLVFIAGMLGTAHCLGMCGPLALALGSGAGGWGSAWLRQSAYTAGRLFTYGVLGAAAGYFGSRLGGTLAAIVNLPAILAIAAGLFLIYQGLLATGWMTPLLARLEVPSRAASPCMAGGLVAPFFRQPGTQGAFLAGVMTGLLPCGLLYGMLALATSSGSVLAGGLAMVVFGLGTAPAMILAGLGGRVIGLAARRRLYTVAACCLILTGMISLGRGMLYLSLGDRPAAGCPACQVTAPIARR